MWTSIESEASMGCLIKWQPVFLNICFDCDSLFYKGGEKAITIEFPVYRGAGISQEFLGG